jgi:hypothetical protein
VALCREQCNSFLFEGYEDVPTQPCPLIRNHATSEIATHFAQYGRCTTTPDTPTVTYFTSFSVPEGIENTKSSILNCTNSMQDSRGREYLFKLKGLPSNFPADPFPTPEERHTVNSQFIDCHENAGQVLNW